MLNGELCYMLHEARVIVEGWRHRYNTQQPHRARGYWPRAPEIYTFLPNQLVGVKELGWWPNQWGLASTAKVSLVTRLSQGLTGSVR